MSGAYKTFLVFFGLGWVAIVFVNRLPVSKSLRNCVIYTAFAVMVASGSMLWYLHHNP